MANQRDPIEYTMTYEQAAIVLGIEPESFRNTHAKHFDKVQRGTARKYLHPEDVFNYKRKRDMGTFVTKPQQNANLVLSS